MTRLKDRIAVVTGSSSGIGQGIAVRFAQEGARVVVNFIGHPDGAEQTLAAIQLAWPKNTNPR
jgi:glucose 1-dehydrogenase